MDIIEEGSTGTLGPTSDLVGLTPAGHGTLPPDPGVVHSDPTPAPVALTPAPAAPAPVSTAPPPAPPISKPPTTPLGLVEDDARPELAASSTRRSLFYTDVKGIARTVKIEFNSYTARVPLGAETFFRDAVEDDLIVARSEERMRELEERAEKAGVRVEFKASLGKRRDFRLVPEDGATIHLEPHQLMSIILEQDPCMANLSCFSGYDGLHVQVKGPIPNVIRRALTSRSGRSFRLVLTEESGEAWNDPTFVLKIGKSREVSESLIQAAAEALQLPPEQVGVYQPPGTIIALTPRGAAEMRRLLMSGRSNTVQKVFREGTGRRVATWNAAREAAHQHAEQDLSPHGLASAAKDQAPARAVDVQTAAPPGVAPGSAIARYLPFGPNAMAPQGAPVEFDPVSMIELTTLGLGELSWVPPQEWNPRFSELLEAIAWNLSLFVPDTGPSKASLMDMYLRASAIQQQAPPAVSHIRDGPFPLDLLVYRRLINDMHVARRNRGWNITQPPPMPAKAPEPTPAPVPDAKSDRTDSAGAEMT